MNGIGERLKLARKKARMSQRDLADRSGVSAMAISKYENNQMMPGSDVLLRLADVLDVRMEFFLRSAPEIDIQPSYRQCFRLEKKDREAVEAEIQEWLERYLPVESFFPGEHGFEMPEGFPYPIEILEDVESAAAALRRTWQLGIDAIGSLTEILEERGIKVGMVKGSDDFDACVFRYDGETPVIAINECRSTDRQRFSLAHELGHIMLDTAAEIDEEQAANRFAGAFLVPAEAARMELGEARSHLDLLELLMLKEKYGMSMSAWVHRVKDLGILAESAADQMRRQINNRGWETREPGNLPPEQPRRMNRLIQRLLAEDVISESRAAELLGISLGVYLKQGAALYGAEPAA